MILFKKLQFFLAETITSFDSYYTVNKPMTLLFKLQFFVEYYSWSKNNRYSSASERNRNVVGFVIVTIVLAVIIIGLSQAGGTLTPFCKHKTLSNMFMPTTILSHNIVLPTSCVLSIKSRNHNEVIQNDKQ